MTYTTFDRLAEWFLSTGAPIIFRFGAIALMILGFELEVTVRTALVLLGTLVLLDFANGWRNAASRKRLYNHANCAICGQPMKYEENYITRTEGPNETRIDWHRHHHGQDVVDRVLKAAGF